MTEASTRTPTTDPPGPGRKHLRWNDEHARALILPLAGLIGVVALVALGACTRVRQEVLIAGITAVVTLTASAAGHAAGLAKSTRE